MQSFPAVVKPVASFFRPACVFEYAIDAGAKRRHRLRRRTHRNQLEISRRRRRKDWINRQYSGWNSCVEPYRFEQAIACRTQGFESRSWSYERYRYERSEFNGLTVFAFEMRGFPLR